MEEAREVIRNEVHDWDSEVMVSVRFKAFSGQRSDWEPRYHFWRDLIIKIARHLRIFIIRPSIVKNVWFNQGGLTPLCIDRVLVLEMYNAGDLSCCGDFIDPKSGQATQLFYKVRNLLPLYKSTKTIEDEYIVNTLLEEKSVEVVKLLSEDHWTSSCIITMNKFELICGGSKEALLILSHLSNYGKAKYLAIRQNDLIEGVKVSLSSNVVSATTSSDYDVLHLVWAEEKLKLHLDAIDQRCNNSRMSALASLKSGNKTNALRHARELKLASESREKCDVLLRRVEEVLRVIADAEESKEVFEAIRSGTKAIKDKQITMEEVQHCLDELDETIYSQKQVDKALASQEFDEEIEDELERLQLEMEHEVSGSSEALSLSNALSDLKVADRVELVEPNMSKVVQLEPS